MSTITIRDITGLSVKERIQFVEDVWDSIAVTPEALPLTSAQREELDYRLDAHRQGPAAHSSWDDVKLRLQR